MHEGSVLQSTQFERVARGDLRSAAAAAQRIELSCQRQAGLRRIPPFGKLRSSRLAAIDLHAEAIEAECVRAADNRIVFLVPETVARLARAASRTHPCWFRDACVLRASRRRSHRPLVQRQLLGIIRVLNRMRSHCPSPHQFGFCDRRVGELQFAFHIRQFARFQVGQSRIPESTRRL